MSHFIKTTPNNKMGAFFVFLLNFLVGLPSFTHSLKDRGLDWENKNIESFWNYLDMKNGSVASSYQAILA
jgi:hypothetical protein